MKLKYKDPGQAASQVSVQYDGRVKNLEVDENGCVQVENQAEAQMLLNGHGGFVEADEEQEQPGHVLTGKTVEEVEEYIKEIKDVERLKQLRRLEDRKTGKEAVDNRIKEINKEEEKEEEEEGENHDEVSEQTEKEDGAETEN